ncbi:MAG: hypothetical protein AB7T06_14855, partial [Kofleriaceae bacterium]
MTRDKSDYLFAMVEPMSRLGTLQFETQTLKDRGKLAEAAAGFTEMETLLRELIRLHEQHNADHPSSPMDIPPLVSSLANTLMMHADVLDAMGDDGEALRMAAIEASSNTSPAEAANRRRDRA